MKRTRCPSLTLPSGHKIRLAFGSCLACRQLVGVCRHQHRLRIWDGLGFSEDGLIRFHAHVCRPQEDPRYKGDPR